MKSLSEIAGRVAGILAGMSGTITYGDLAVMVGSKARAIGRIMTALERRGLKNLTDKVVSAKTGQPACL
jgi:alkylated DNA nucleotide flippase Atl1